MSKQEERDFLWEVIMFITDAYGYRTELVVSNQKKFAPFIMVAVPIKGITIGYINIDVMDMLRIKEQYGENKTVDVLTEQLEKKLDILRKNFGI